MVARQRCSYPGVLGAARRLTRSTLTHPFSAHAPPSPLALPLDRTVAAGGSLLDPKATSVVLERLRKGDAPTDPRYESLSPQERRILGLIADGLTNRQIGTEMFLAEKTVKNYVSSLLHKLGFARRTDAAVYAAEMRKNSR
jgi:DNA-binding NarL/FixJ family response regulator